MRDNANGGSGRRALPLLRHRALNRPSLFVPFRDAFVSDDVAGPQGAELGRREAPLAYLELPCFASAP